MFDEMGFRNEDYPGWCLTLYHSISNIWGICVRGHWAEMGSRRKCVRSWERHWWFLQETMQEKRGRRVLTKIKPTHPGGLDKAWNWRSWRGHGGEISTALVSPNIRRAGILEAYPKCDLLYLYEHKYMA